MTAGRITSFAPDFIEAKVSAARIFKILDRVPTIDSSSGGDRLVSTLLPIKTLATTVSFYDMAFYDGYQESPNGRSLFLIFTKPIFNAKLDSIN